MRILAIAAHPDDEVIGCGGAIARLAREGHSIYIAILGEGITSRYANRDDADKSQVETLKKNGERCGCPARSKRCFYL